MPSVVAIGNRGSVTLGQYVQAWRVALAAAPGSEFRSGFSWYPQTREEILREFRRGLHDRINRRLDGFGHVLRPKRTSRKLSYEWQIETYRAAQQLNQTRLVIHWLPLWLRERFAHRLDAKNVQ